MADLPVAGTHTYDLSLGPPLISSWLNFGLYALEISMMLAYFRKYPRDYTWHRAAVIVAFLSDSTTVMCNAAAIYMYLISHFGDVGFATTQPWPIPLYVLSTGFSAVCCQLFLATRICRLTRSYLWFFLFGPMIACGLAGAIGDVVAISKWNTLAERAKLNTMIILWLISNAVCDVILAGVLIFCLQRVKSDWAKTRGLISRLSAQAVKTGSATAICALLGFITYEQNPSSNVCLIFGMTLGRIYTLTMLFNLNGRESQGDGTGRDADNISSGIKSAPIGDAEAGKARKAARFGSSNKHRGINVETHQMTVYEEPTDSTLELGYATRTVKSYPFDTAAAPPSEKEGTSLKEDYASGISQTDLIRPDARKSSF